MSKLLYRNNIYVYNSLSHLWFLNQNFVGILKPFEYTILNKPHRTLFIIIIYIMFRTYNKTNCLILNLDHPRSEKFLFADKECEGYVIVLKHLFIKKFQGLYHLIKL